MNLFLPVLVLALVFAGIGIYFFIEPPTKYIGPVERVTISISEGLVEAPILTASERGFYSEYGLGVSFKRTQGGK